MDSTTPTTYRPRSTSRTHRDTLPSRPTTPLRASTSRTSLRASTTTPSHQSHHHDPLLPPQTNTINPLDTLEPAFAEFSDSMADLEANLLHLQLLQDSLSRFNENFGSLLYGLNMNAFTVDFTEAPGSESFRRWGKEEGREGVGYGHHVEGYAAVAGVAAAAASGAGTVTHGTAAGLGGGLGRDVDATFLTSDTSFVENPPTPRTTASSRTKNSTATPSTASSRTTAPTRGGGGIGRGSSIAAPRGSGRGRGAPVVRGTRASQLAASRRETLAAARGRGSGSASGIRSS